KGIPAWRTPAIVPLMVTTGLAEGAGLFLVGTGQEFAAIAVVLLVVLRGLAWRSYMARLQADGAPTRALEVLETFAPWFFVLGLLTPAMLIVFGLVATNATALPFALAG